MFTENKAVIEVIPKSPFHEEVVIEDWPDRLPAGWMLGTYRGSAALLSEGDPEAPPSRAAAWLKGDYAIYVLDYYSCVYRP